MWIDSHQHFWQYNPAHQVWMTDAMDVLRRDYLPGELGPLLKASGLGGAVAVQARQMVEETEWLLKLSEEYEFIQGVVGWVDLRSPDVREQLANMRGIRSSSGSAMSFTTSRTIASCCGRSSSAESLCLPISIWRTICSCFRGIFRSRSSS